jgi:hypothetical protein
VRSLGGSHGATASARAGRRTAGRLAAFFATTATVGVATAAREFGIGNFLGADVEVFLAALADALAPEGALTEDAIARRAALSALDDLFDRFGVIRDGIDALNRLTPDAVHIALERYAAHYVFERILQALSSHIENNSISSTRAIEVERIVWAYIESEVTLEAGGRDFRSVDWRGAEGHQLLGSIFERSFAIVERAADEGGAAA